ncbi:hypothetical protein FWJ32_05000 [Calorimonas adulescens]|uniref:Uncharacterized protein n=1 Tax=Calorimonas adulescens TaxID=2606906 RepID=A0A5D8QEN1_9THEO|nr:hypothetical protein FWJ32_05000 [Calorimonas adulescens]
MEKISVSDNINGNRWMRSFRKKGSVKPLPINDKKRILEIQKRLEDIARENNTLNKLLEEKELELTILRDLRDRVNPR